MARLGLTLAFLAGCATPPTVHLRAHTPLFGELRPAGLRVLSLNIARGAGQIPLAMGVPPENFPKNLEAIATLIRRETPDVVALQEVDASSPWTSSFDNLIHLGQHTGYIHGFLSLHTRVDWFGLAARPGIWGGSALLSRLPFTNQTPVAFAVDALDVAGMAIATVQPPGWDFAVDVVSVHLNPESAQKRARQVEMMQADLAPRRRPLIVMGDMNNATDDPDPVEELCRRLGLTAFRADAALPTYPADAPAVRLDWILVSKELHFVTYHRVPEQLSDHLPVLATIAPQAMAFALNSNADAEEH